MDITSTVSMTEAFIPLLSNGANAADVVSITLVVFCALVLFLGACWLAAKGVPVR